MDVGRGSGAKGGWSYQLIPAWIQSIDSGPSSQRNPKGRVAVVVFYFYNLVSQREERDSSEVTQEEGTNHECSCSAIINIVVLLWGRAGSSR